MKLSDDKIQELIGEARKAAEFAYCPYSKFHVGAALLCKDGTIICGCNVENSSFSPTVCAERTAIGNAVIQGKKEFEAIAVFAKPTEKIAMPCGVCRQVLSEFCDDLTIICSNEKGEFKICTLKELLPHSFSFTD